MDRIRKSGDLLQDVAYVGQNLSLPMRGTTQDVCSGMCVSTLKCDAWVYAQNGTCTLLTLGDEVHNLIAEGKSRIPSISKAPSPGSVSGRIHYERRGNIYHTVLWILLGVLVILGTIHLMGDCAK